MSEGEERKAVSIQVHFDKKTKRSNKTRREEFEKMKEREREVKGDTKRRETSLPFDVMFRVWRREQVKWTEIEQKSEEKEKKAAGPERTWKEWATHTYKYKELEPFYPEPWATIDLLKTAHCVSKDSSLLLKTRKATFFSHLLFSHLFSCTFNHFTIPYNLHSHVDVKEILSERYKGVEKRWESKTTFESVYLLFHLLFLKNQKREEGGEETGSIEGGTRDSCSSCNRKNFAGKRRSILFSVSLVVLLSLVLFLVRRLNLIFTRGSHKKNDWRETERKESSSHSLCSTTYTCSFLFFNTSIFSDFSVVVFMFAPLLLLHQFLELPISSLTTSCFTLWSPLRVLSYFLSFKTQTEGCTDRNKQNMRR